jgi:hypothetical protein
MASASRGSLGWGIPLQLKGHAVSKRLVLAMDALVLFSSHHHREAHPFEHIEGVVSRGALAKEERDELVSRAISSAM